MDRSMDSIGSCSLDVDAESTDISDTSGSLNFPTPISIKDITREFTNNIRERCSLQTSVKNTTAFVDPVTGQVCIAITQPATTITVTTTPIIPVNNTIKKTLYRPIIVGGSPISTTTTSSSSSFIKTTSAIFKASPKSPELIVNEKKPSYLSLACCVNGYSNITTYDSKIRQDINKSREVSPIRPSTSALQYCKKSNSLAPPVLLTMSNMNGSKPTTKIPSARVMNSCDNKSEIDMGVRRKHHYIETNGGDGTSVSASTTVMMEKNGTNELPKENSQSKLSFIQQRVERLYGPGALAQGFYIPKKTSNTDLQYENGNVDNAASLAQITRSSSVMLSPSGKESNQFRKNTNTAPIILSTDCGSDNELIIHDLNGDRNDDDDDDDDVIIDLPCLRHLSQEFRAQLPSISPKRQYMVRNVNGQEQQQKQQHHQQQHQKSQQKRSSKEQQTSQHERNRSRNLTLFNGGSDGSGDGGGVDIGDSDDEAISMKNNSSNYSLDEVDHKITLTIVSLDGNTNDNNEVKSTVSVASSSKQREDTTIAATKNNRNNSGISIADYKPIKKDGHYFLQQLQIEQQRLLKLADIGDMYLKMLMEKSHNEDILGLLRSASGKARLLVSQKMKQFEGLCYNNLNSTADDKFPTTVDDLQGFWDMVYLQIDQVDSIFRDIEELKANDWRKPSEHFSQYSKNNGNGARTTSNAATTRSRLNNKRPPPNTKLTNGSNIPTAIPTTSTTAAVKREMQRKKLQEFKRRNRAAMVAADDDTANDFCTKNLS